jgi:hypothetical protein
MNDRTARQVIERVADRWGLPVTMRCESGAFGGMRWTATVGSMSFGPGSYSFARAVERLEERVQLRVEGQAARAALGGAEQDRTTTNPGIPCQ